MRSTNAVTCFSSEIIRVLFRVKDHVSRCNVQRIVLADEFQVWQTEKTWNVCVVHLQLVSESIDFIREHSVTVFILRKTSCVDILLDAFGEVSEFNAEGIVNRCDH